MTVFLMVTISALLFFLRCLIFCLNLWTKCSTGDWGEYAANFRKAPLDRWAPYSPSNQCILMRCQEGIVQTSFFTLGKCPLFLLFWWCLWKSAPPFGRLPPDCLRLLTRSSTPLVLCGDQHCPLRRLLRLDNLACDILVTISGLYYGVTISLVTFLWQSCYNLACDNLVTISWQSQAFTTVWQSRLSHSPPACPSSHSAFTIGACVEPGSRPGSGLPKI